MHEVDRLARDTALLEVMGPYPVASLRFMQNADGRGERRARPSARQVKVDGQGGRSDRLPRASAGACSISCPARSMRRRRSPGREEMQTIRNLVTSARLGGALFASLSDFGTARLTAKLNGVPTWRIAPKAISPPAQPGLRGGPAHGGPA